MKAILLSLWLLLPLAGLAYHFGPGQDRLKNDRTARLIDSARSAAAKKEHADAVKACDDALAALPEGPESTHASRMIRLLRAKERLPIGQLPEGHDELAALLVEVENDPQADASVKRETREALASAKYYLTWLMRLEGGAEEEWGPEIETSRQHFRQLAEEAAAAGNAEEAATQQQNLESAIRLARMDLNELQGAPIPKQCKNCKSGKCKPAPAKKTEAPSDSRKAGKTLGEEESGS